MNIDFFCAKYPYANDLLNNENYFCGGSIIVAHELISELQKKEVNSNVFTSANSNKYEVTNNKNLTIHRYPTHLNLLSSNISLNMGKKVSRRTEVGDIVHSHFDLPPSPCIAYKYAKEKNLPFVITYHGDWMDNYGSILRQLLVKSINQTYTKKILDFSDVIICPSEQYIDESRYLSNYREKIKIIPNGVNFQKYNVSKSKLECRNILNIEPELSIILYLGALTERKGADILIKAYNKISNKYPDTLLLIAGSGSFKSELELLIGKYDLQEKVKLLGYVEENMKPLLYRASDIFCLPSTVSTEVFPLVLLEAALNHLAIITSDLNTFQCFIENGKNGIITKKGDFEDLSLALSLVIEDTKFQREIGEAANNKAKKYSWSKIADKTINVYNELLEQ